MSQDDLSSRLASVREEIDAAAERSGRRGADVTLVVVTKAAPAAIFAALLERGVTDVGENRAQHAAERMSGFEGAFRWHFIGHVQSNKARRLVERFDVFHGVDSLPLLQRLDRVAGELSRAPELLLQVNVSGEASKSGFAPEELGAALEVADTLRNTTVTGLMTMAPLVDDPEHARPVFRALAELAAAHAGTRRLDQLSMGMTDDFAVAVEEGATLVRIGRRITSPVPMT